MSRPETTPIGERVPFLVDRRLDRQLARFGFATLQLVDRSTAAATLAEHSRLRPDPGTGFDADLDNPDQTYRRAAASAIERHLGDALRQRVVGHEPFLWNFLCKWPHDDEQLYLHRDWSFVDERSGARSYSIWVALQDITGHNGQLRVLPGSHLLPSGVSGTHLSPDWLEHRDVIEPRLVTIPRRAGEAVVLDHATVHGSFGNHTGAARVAAGIAFRPAAEPLVHFWADEDGSEARRYDVDPDFFVTHTPSRLAAGEPAYAEHHPVSPTSRTLSPEDLARALDRATSLGARLGRRLAG